MVSRNVLNSQVSSRAGNVHRATTLANGSQSSQVKQLARTWHAVPCVECSVAVEGNARHSCGAVRVVWCMTAFALLFLPFPPAPACTRGLVAAGCHGYRTLRGWPTVPTVQHACSARGVAANPLAVKHYLSPLHRCFYRMLGMPWRCAARAWCPLALALPLACFLYTSSRAYLSIRINPPQCAAAANGAVLMRQAAAGDFPSSCCQPEIDAQHNQQILGVAGCPRQ